MRRKKYIKNSDSEPLLHQGIELDDLGRYQEAIIAHCKAIDIVNGYARTVDRCNGIKTVVICAVIEMKPVFK